MKIIGLTGSIGMGKSAIARFFKSFHIPVHDADEAVHRLLACDRQAISRVEAAFPGVAKEGTVDRKALARRIEGSKSSIVKLEKIIHPLVRAAEKRFLLHAAAQRRPLVILEIPLLYETGAERRCDAVIVASAPFFIQKSRVLKRPGMTGERFEFLRSRQTPDAKKRQKADFIVQTGLGFAVSFRAVKKIIRTSLRKNALSLSKKR